MFIQEIISLEPYKYQYSGLGFLYMNTSVTLATRTLLLVYVLVALHVKVLNYVTNSYIKVKNVTSIDLDINALTPQNPIDITTNSKQCSSH